MERFVIGPENEAIKKIIYIDKKKKLNFIITTVIKCHFFLVFVENKIKLPVHTKFLK